MARTSKLTRIGFRPEHGCRMRVAVVLAVALAIATLGPPAGAPASPTSATGPADRVRVIVELDASPALAAVARGGTAAAAPRHEAWDRAAERAAELRNDHQELLRDASRAGVDVGVVHRLTAAYNGMVVEVPAPDIGELAALPAVRAVHEDVLYEHTLTESVPLVGAPEVWERTDPKGVPVTGTGVVVAVVDSGIDYTHPDLGGGFGPGHKVVAGYDFVNKDADPLDDNGHGTHVAGIVAADGAVRGVAPDATLTAYKVIGQFGSGQLADILAGLDAAVAPDNPYRADVVNLSLSGPGDGTDPLSVAASQAAAAGVVVVAAAGNLGPFPQSITSPAGADGVLAVGASTSGVLVPRARMIEPTQRDLQAVRQSFSANPQAAARVLKVVDIGFGDPGSYDDVDVTGAAVLISTFFGDDQLAKAMHAEKRGAAAAFFYTPDYWAPVAAEQARPLGPRPGRDLPSDISEGDSFPTGVADDGRLETLVAMTIPGPNAAALQERLDEARVEIAGVDATDQLADFSSRGPTRLFTQKPDLVAPGVEILSTLPNGTHGRASGTSMAAPHVAGAAALVRQLHPDWESDAVTAALTGSAHTLDAAGPLDQGAGRLDVAAAASIDLLTAPSGLSFGLADLSGDQVDRSRTLTMRNVGGDPATLTLSIERHDSAEAAVTVEPSTVRLDPGERADIEVRARSATPDADADVAGWVVADDGTRTHEVPFLLAVRHLGVHVTPDPAVPNTQTAAFISSPADLVGPPTVTVTCPGLAPQHPEAEPFSTRLWRATVTVADPGACQVGATGVAAERYGSPTLAGSSRFEAVATPDGGQGVDRWQSIGPNAEAGRLAFNVTPNANQMAVVPIDSPSAFITQDRMRTWQEMRTMPMAGGAPVSVAVHRGSGDLYVAVDGVGDGSYAGRIMHSDDGGRSWRILPGLDERLRHVAIDGAGRALAVATRDNTVRVTLNGGSTWAVLPSPWNDVQDLHWIGSDLYVGTFSDGLLVVRDAAGPNPADPEPLFRPGLLGFADNVAGDADTLIVTTWPLPSVFVSHDDGGSFKRVLETPGISFLDVALVGDDIHALQGSGNLWIGRDRGAEWERWGDPLPAAVEFDVAPSPWSDSVFVSSSGAGIYTADQPGEFQRVGVPGAWVYDLATTDGADGEALVAGTFINTFRTTMAGRAVIRPEDLEWDSSGGEGTAEGAAAEQVATSPADSSVVYKLITEIAGTFGIYRSDNGGATWDRLSRPSGRPFALLVHPGDPDRIYTSSFVSDGNEGLAVSTDRGATWRKINHGRTFSALAGDPTNPDRIWAGEGFGSGRNGLWLSEDGGLTFDRLSDVPVTAIAVDPDDPDKLIIGGRGLYTSNDGGQSLTAADHVNLDMWINDLEFRPGDDGQVFAAAGAFYDELGALKGGRGVLVSDDGGGSWESFTAGLTNPNVTSLATDSRGRYLYAGIGGGSVHRIKLEDDTSSD